MTKIQITMEVYDECADPDHEFGITEDAYTQIVDDLGSYGDDIQIEKVN